MKKVASLDTDFISKAHRISISEGMEEHTRRVSG